jgi:hypothetical protein
VIAFQQNVSSKMLEKLWITQTDFDRFVPGVKLTGPAAAFLTVKDTTVITEPLEDIISRP